MILDTHTVKRQNNCTRLQCRTCENENWGTIRSPPHKTRGLRVSALIFQLGQLFLNFDYNYPNLFQFFERISLRSFKIILNYLKTGSQKTQHLTINFNGIQIIYKIDSDIIVLRLLALVRICLVQLWALDHIFLPKITPSPKKKLPKFCPLLRPSTPVDFLREFPQSGWDSPRNRSNASGSNL
jgi:hypothetical protein